MFAIVAYHWNPSFQSSVPLELIALVGLEDEFLVESRPRDARIGIKVTRVLRQACLDAFWRDVVVGHLGGRCSYVVGVGRNADAQKATMYSKS